MGTAAPDCVDFYTRDYVIRPLVRADLPAVLNIGVGDIEESWSKDMFVDLLGHIMIEARVCERNEQIVGFMVYRVYCRHVTIMNLAVADEARRSGVATNMIDYLIAGMRPEKKSMIAACAHNTNDAAIAWLSKVGFRASFAPNLYGNDDGLTFNWKLRPRVKCITPRS